MPGPLDGRVERVGAVGIARFDRGSSPQRVVGGARIARSPFDTRVDTDLPEDVDQNAGLAERDGVVAVS
jgi:hypothetical protein